MVIGQAPHRVAQVRTAREPDAEIARLLEPTIRRLTGQLGATCSAQQIYLAATRAMLELRGSIHTEALPEMVGRLVAARLS